jgi:hypothetical protein
MRKGRPGWVVYALIGWFVLGGAMSQQIQGQATSPPYRIYKPDGQPATLDDIVAALARVEVVFIGESHDDPGAHALQRDLLQAAHARYGTDTAAEKRQVVLSLEMFERDVQLVLDEYLGRSHSRNPVSGVQSSVEQLPERLSSAGGVRQSPAPAGRGGQSAPAAT